MFVVRLLRRATLLGLWTVMGVGCGTGGSRPQPTASAMCIELSGQRIDAMRWNAAGDVLALSTFDLRTAEGVIWRINPPAGGLAEIARGSSILPLAGVAVGAALVGWVELRDGNPYVVTLGEDSTEEAALRTEQLLYGIQVMAGDFIGIGQDSQTIVRVDGDGSVSPLLAAHGRVESLDVSVDGTRLVYEETDGPGTTTRFVYRRSDHPQTEVDPPGRLIGSPVLGSDLDGIYYEDHDVGALRRIDVETSTTRTVITADVSAVAIAPDGRIAYTFVAPTETSQLCVDPGGG